MGFDEMSPAAMRAWEMLQASWGSPLSVNSAYRDPAKNAAVGGAKKSQHMHGNAFDVSTAGMSQGDIARLTQAAQAAGFKGFGGYDNSVHFDVGPSRTWGADYTNKTTPKWLSDALGNANAQPQQQTERRPMEPQQQRGLLGSLGIQKMEEGAEGELGQRFYKRDTFKDTAAKASQAFAALGSNPAVQKFADNAAGQRAESKSKNKTIEFLRASGQGYLADAIESGGLGAKDAMGLLMNQRYGAKKDTSTSAQKDYLFSVQNDGYKGTFADWVLAKGKAGGTSVTVDVNGNKVIPDADIRGKLDKDTGVTWAGYTEAGNKAYSIANDMELLTELTKTAPQGPIQGRLAEMFPGFSSAGAAVQSIVKRLAPTMRAEGSGSTSDIEYNAMLQSLPALENKPEANRMIIEIMKGKAQIDIERATIVSNYQNRDIDATQARKAFIELNKRSIMTSEMKAAIAGLTPTSATAVSGNAKFNPLTGKLER